MLTQEYLKSLFDYHSDGFFIWRRRPREHFKTSQAHKRWNTLFYGKKAGDRRRCELKNGILNYLFVTIGGKRYTQHRIIFLYHNGFLPEYIDHIDRDKSNNRIENLRGATRAQNHHNRSARKDSSSGYKGVTWDTECGKWKVAIKSNKKTFYIGRFKDKTDGAKAYNEAALKHHGEYAFLNPIPV